MAEASDPPVRLTATLDGDASEPTDVESSPAIGLKPGWQSSEAWITLLTMILGAIPSSGLTTNAPLLARVVGMAIAALAALHYTAQRTSLKRTHVAFTRNREVV